MDTSLNDIVNLYFQKTSGMYDTIIVGAGLSGAVFAERIATVCGWKCLVIDKRNHIAGNCYDYIDDITGIRVNKYGAHLFHTNSEKVWKYVKKFSSWERWDHKVLAYIDQKYVSIPVNITTVNKLCYTDITTEDKMQEWLQNHQVQYPDGPADAEQMAKSRVGEQLYEKIFLDYTKKQWNKHPKELDASVTARIPVRCNFDDRYFSDQYQYLPCNGYTHVVKCILKHPNITVQVNTDFEDLDKEWVKSAKLIVYTGPLDQYFKEAGLPTLQFRSLKFHTEYFFNCKGYMLPNSVVNYPQGEVKFTRSVEYKHFLHQSSEHSIVISETSTSSGEPYYPVPNKRNIALYEKYKYLADQEEACGKVIFVGRLANYKYFNMDQAILNSLEVFQSWYEMVFS